MYTIVETGGKQYKMAVGDVLDIELLSVEIGKNFVLDKVLFFSGKDEIKIGQPYVEGAKVQVAVVDKFKDKKVIVFKYKNKTGYKRLRGHRQNYNRVKVEKIEIPGIGEITEAAVKPKKEAAKKTAKAVRKTKAAAAAAKTADKAPKTVDAVPKTEAKKEEAANKGEK